MGFGHQKRDWIKQQNAWFPWGKHIIKPAWFPQEHDLQILEQNLGGYSWIFQLAMFDYHMDRIRG